MGNTFQPSLSDSDCRFILAWVVGYLERRDPDLIACIQEAADTEDFQIRARYMVKAKTENA